MNSVQNTHSPTVEQAWRSHSVFGVEDHPLPDRFVYHYTSLASAAAIALTGELSLGPMWNVNDPIEASFPEIIPTTSSAGVPRTVSEADRKDAQSELDEMRQNVRLVCFALDGPEVDAPDTAQSVAGRGYAQSSMWAHYGDSHKGIVLVLDRHELEQRARTMFGDDVALGPIQYDRGYSGAHARAQIVDFDQLNPKDHFDTAIRKSLLTKSSDWEQEREYRVAATAWTETDCSISTTGLVQGVVLGAKFDDFRFTTAVKVAEKLTNVSNTAILGFNNQFLVPYPITSKTGQAKWWTERDRYSELVFS